jgi:hypothetical protein
LARLVKQGLVEVKDAETYATDVNAFRMFLESGQM